MRIFTYVAQTFNWCEDCVKSESVRKMVNERPLYQLDAPDAGKCDKCGAERTMSTTVSRRPLSKI